MSVAIILRCPVCGATRYLSESRAHLQTCSRKCREIQRTQKRHRWMQALRRCADMGMNRKEAAVSAGISYPEAIRLIKLAGINAMFPRNGAASWVAGYR